jgi:signal transduction histidine kinase
MPLGTSVRQHFRSINVYLAAILAISTIAIVLVCWFAASRQNEQSLNGQKFVASNDTEEALEGLHVRLMQMAYWQDAYDNIARKWNQKWIAYQFGPYLDFYNIHTVAIFGPNDQLRYLYASGKGSRVSRETLAKAQGLRTLLKAVRSAPVRQPPRLREGMVIIAGLPYFASASIVTPENDTDYPVARERQFAVVVLGPATAAKFEALVEGYGVKDLRASPGNNVPKGLVAITMPDAVGKPLAWLEWTPARPSTDFLKVVVPPIILLVLLLTLARILVMRRWQRLQRELITAETKAIAAEEESRSKSAFLGTISHELRTPLNAIIGFSDVLLKQLFGPLGSPRYQDYAAHIQSSGQALLKIVNDVIELARIEAQDTALEREAFDAAGCALGVIEAARNDAAAKHVSLLFESRTNDTWCTGSELSFRQALARLVENAIHYSKDGGTVTLSLTRNAEEIALCVTDEGDGIAPGDLEKIGKKFLHVENHLVTSDYDTGLGPVIVKGLMELMGGSFSIASEEGMGTTVTLRLIAAEAPRAAAKIKKTEKVAA